MSMSLESNPSQIIDVSTAETDYNYLRQDAGGMITEHNGVADRLLKNDKLYRSMKGDWKREGWNGSQNVKTTTGREDGKFYIRREQFNTEYIKFRCAEYRKAAEAGFVDPLAPYMPDGKIGYKWMDLPDVIAIRISDQYFGGMPWGVLKNDRTLKAQFYQVVQREYPEYVCYPGGRMPIPIQVPYPARSGETKFFKGI
jgi:hypothetical protein